jgi:hypothetical protein
MTDEQEQHLMDIIGDFNYLVDSRYRAGQKEHGGDLFRKKGIIDMALEEAVDMVVYLLTLKRQIEESGAKLGEIDGE